MITSSMDSSKITRRRMSAADERSKPPLHNFTMPPNLRWGNQRFLRCMKVNSDPPESDHHGIAAIRHKVIIDLQTAADNMKHAIFNNEAASPMSKPAPAPAADPPPPTVSWNLRTRRAACRTPAAGVDASPGPSSAAAVVVEKSSPRLLRSEKKERAKFAVSLSKKEIEEDFLAMVAHRPQRRPKKRPRNVQKYLDGLVPGSWLSEVTPDMYKVTEPAAP